MEIALGVSMTPTTVRMVLVEGDKADGLTMDCDQFALTPALGTPSASASEQVSAAILATDESASSRGHHLCTCGIALSGECEADELRASLDARDVADVILVGELQAAAALAHAVARAVGYAATGLLFIERRRAVLAIVDTADCSVAEVVSRSFDGADLTAVLTEMLASPIAQGPQGLFIVDSGGRAPALKAHLEAASSLPIIFPEEPEWALARGAALAAAMAPRFDASTSGFAYAQDPDGEDFAPVAMETGPLARADVVTRRADADVFGCASTETPREPDVARSAVRRFLSVGSLAASILVIGVVAMVMALAANFTTTSTQRALEMQTISPPAPGAAAPAPPPATYQAAPMPHPSPVLQAPPVPAPAPVQPPPPAPLSSAAKTVRVEQAPRTVLAPAPAPKAAQAPAQSVAEPQAPAVAPASVDVEPMPAAAPAPVLPAAPPPPEIPLFGPPLPSAAPAPVNQAPAVAPQAPILRWLLQRIPVFTPPQQPQPISQASTPQWPQYQAPQWPQQPPVLQPQTPRWPLQAQSPVWPQEPAYMSPGLAPAPTLPSPQTPSGSSGFPDTTVPMTPSGDGSWSPSTPLWPYR
jgi:hypothetical protein